MKSKVADFFNDFGPDSMHLVHEFYHPEVVFEDPLGRIDGIEKLQEYYEHMYRNVTDIRFDFSKTVLEGQRYCGAWKMYLKAKGLAGGEEVSLDGLSLIEFDMGSDKAIYHRDYFDLDAFVYQHVPVLRNVLGFIKSKLVPPGH